jgi:hypothetical protein
MHHARDASKADIEHLSTYSSALSLLGVSGDVDQENFSLRELFTSLPPPALEQLICQGEKRSTGYPKNRGFCESLGKLDEHGGVN